MIILTSFAPSPIASVVIFAYFFSSLTIFTISAFYFGETLHAITTSASSVSIMNYFKSIALLVIFKSYSPPTITAQFLLDPIFFF